jgi:hypothetical protein
MVDIVKSKTTKIEYSVSLRFMISQHSRDEQLRLNLIQYFNCLCCLACAGHMLQRVVNLIKIIIV